MSEGFPVGTSVSFVDQFGYRIYGAVQEFVDGRYTILGDDKLTYAHIEAARVGVN